jgi:hypothetical protein
VGTVIGHADNVGLQIIAMGRGTQGPPSEANGGEDQAHNGDDGQGLYLGPVVSEEHYF